MPKQPQKKRNPQNKQSQGKNNANSQPKASPSQDTKPLVPMLVGAAIFALLAVLFLMPINGKTPFSHFLDLFPKATPEDAQVQKAGQSAQTKATSNDKAKNETPKAQSTPKPTVSEDVKTAAPLENTTDEDEEGLDRLIQEKTAN